MQNSWIDALVLALGWACAWGSVLAAYGLSWNLEWMRPRLWYWYLKHRLNRASAFFTHDTGIPRKILPTLEALLSALESGSAADAAFHAGPSYRKKYEREQRQLRENGLCHEIRMIYPKLAEEYEKNQDFKHWSDAGREWREITLRATVLNRYRDKKSGKVVYEDFFPHGSVLLRQSRHIRHDAVADKSRNEEQQFYADYHKITCPSCGAEVTLTGETAHCPYCGGYIKSDFFDWQTEEFLIYQEPNPNLLQGGLLAGVMAAFFVPAVPCFRFIRNAYLMVGVTVVLTMAVALVVWRWMIGLTEGEKGLSEQIVRYDERVLAVDLNEALFDTESTKNALLYSVDKIRLKHVDNTDTRTTITVQAVLHKLILSDWQHITAQDETLCLKLYRARYPRRMKSKGQAVFHEKECPRCGANFLPDANGCCSYCGYQLAVDNAKWRIEQEESR